MRSRTVGTIAVLTAGGISAAILVISPLAAAAQNTTPVAPTTGPRVLTGTVVDENGSPVPHARIQVFAEDHSNDDVLALIPLARSMSNANGGFVVSGQLQHQVKLNPDSSIPLEVDVTTSDEMTKTFNLNATSPTDPGGQWTWGEQVDENLVPDKPEGQADAMAHHGVDGITLDMTHAWPAPEAQPGANRQTGNNGDVTPADTGMTWQDCMSNPWYKVQWVFNGNTEDHYIPVQKVDTQDRARFTYQWSNTQKTMLQVAFNPSGSADPYAAGMDYSIENGVADGVNQSFGNDHHGAYELNWRFRNYTKFCTTLEWVDTYAEYKQYGVSSGDHKWMAHHWLSGQNFDSRYDLYYCYSDVPPQPILGDTWVARYTSKRLHGYFSIIGVSLDASQENDKDNYELHFAPDHDGGKAYICGNNSDPFHARMVRETNP